MSTLSNEEMLRVRHVTKKVDRIIQCSLLPQDIIVFSLNGTEI